MPINLRGSPPAWPSRHTDAWSAGRPTEQIPKVGAYRVADFRLRSNAAKDVPSGWRLRRLRSADLGPIRPAQSVSSRAYANDRLPRASGNRVEGGDSIVEG